MKTFTNFAGAVDEVRVLHRLIHEDDYLYTLLFKPSLYRENKMRLVGAHLNFDRDTIADVLGNIQVRDTIADVLGNIPYYLPCEPIYRLSKTSYLQIVVVLRHVFSYYFTLFRIT